MLETNKVASESHTTPDQPALLQYTKAQSISLKGHSQLTERWLQDRISDDPRILGLGNVDLIQRERTQFTSGRLDLLLYDRADDIRYEVELMLGSADESHIIRCIEYWDIERRQYPAYDHCAVLVAENVTSRFLNVLSLIAGSIPLIVIQLSALQVGDQVMLNFVRVLDRMPLRRDDEAEVITTSADRSFWVERAALDTVAMADEILQMLNEKASPMLQLRYNRSYIGLTAGGRVSNVVWMEPKERFTYVMTQEISEPQPWLEKLEASGLNAGIQAASGTLRLSLRPSDLRNHRDLIRDLLHAIVLESQQR
jgi:hypothetical protein